MEEIIQKDKRGDIETKVREVFCRTALSQSRLPGYDYTLNPYRGCAHDCKYCYAPSILRTQRSEWGSCVKVRRNMPKVLANELKNKKKGVVGISTVTDPYQPLENSYQLTRYCLEQLLRYEFPVSILTKSALVKRDIDLLSKFPKAEVGFTITTDDETERTLLEPKASSIGSRISALEECSTKGITTYAFFGPLYPTMEEEALSRLVKTIKRAGASKIMADRLNLKSGVWESVYKALEKNTVARRIWKEAVFGENDRYDRLFLFLEKICQKNDIEFDMQTY